MNSWRPDRESYIPLYLQIEQHIKEKILHGKWTIGTKIPSQRKLAEELQVNRSTVTAAVDELIAQGLLEGKRIQQIFKRIGEHGRPDLHFSSAHGNAPDDICRCDPACCESRHIPSRQYKRDASPNGL